MFAAARAADVARCEHWFRAATEARLQPSGAMYTALVTSAADSWMQDIVSVFMFHCVSYVLKWCSIVFKLLAHVFAADGAGGSGAGAAGAGLLVLLLLMVVVQRDVQYMCMIVL